MLFDNKHGFCTIVQCTPLYFDKQFVHGNLSVRGYYSTRTHFKNVE